MSLSSRALCRVTDVETELNLTPGAQDVRLERLIETATGAIERHCARSNGFHYEAARVDDVPGFGTVLMHLPKTPVLSIGSIVWDPDDANDTVTASLYAIDNAVQGRIYREGGWQWTAARREYMVATPLPSTEQSLYRATYACGWVTRVQIATGGAFVAVSVAITSSGTTATVVHTGHNLVTGMEVLVAGATETEYNGTYTITVVDADTYTYTFAGSSTTPATGSPTSAPVSTLPYDLEDACIQLVSLRYQWNPRDPTVASEKIDSWSASYNGTTGSGIPPGIADLLASYRRIV